MSLLRNHLFTTSSLLLSLLFVFTAATPATTFTVTKTADTNDTVCDSDCSLREALAAANAAATDDIINFDPIVFATKRTIGADTGDFEISGNGNLVINGPGLDLLTLTGNTLVRVFTLTSGANVTINGVSLINGGGRGTENFLSGGGGIYNQDGSLTINNSSIINNKVFVGAGGGIYNGGTLSLNNSTVRGNSTDVFQGSCGGGIYNAPGSRFNAAESKISNNTAGEYKGGGVCNSENVTTNIIDSTLSNNNTTLDSGAGIFNSSGGTMNITRSVFTNNRNLGNSSYGTGGAISNNGMLTIIDSTFNGNSAPSGGAILNGSSGILIISTSTISANLADSGNGGGIANTGILNLTNSTVSGNSAVFSTSFNGGDGGGIFNSGSALLTNATINKNTAIRSGGGIQNNSGSVTVLNTIIADNSAGQNGGPDFSGALNSRGYNLIENTFGTIIMGITSGNILGQDPQLFPLRDNGGLTKTAALPPGSPAIDAGDPQNFLATDQRGITRPQDGDLNSSVLPDIGAYETNVTIYPVTKIADTNDGRCDADCSLREAIAATNSAVTPDNLIVFNGSLFATSQTITLTNGEIVIANNANMTLTGTGANLLNVSGNHSSRIFSLSTGAAAAIYNITVTGGGSLENGGAIYNRGILLIQNSSINDSIAANYGGGIFNDANSTLNLHNSILSNNRAIVGGGIFNFTGSKLSVTNSTIDGNFASSGFAGGLSNNGGTLVLNASTISGNSGSGIYNGGLANLINATVSGNTTGGAGGGIYNDGTLGLESVTIAFNRANVSGGGVAQNAGDITVYNSIIADNTALNSAPDFSGYFYSQGYNLIENISGTTIGGSTFQNITGRDPQLLPLGNYGGPTPTHALKLTSPAIDKGNSFTIDTDQRGQRRPYDFPIVSNASSGNGTDIGAFERQAADLRGKVIFDFDGDGRADISVFRPSSGAWYRLNSADQSFFAASFGTTEDKIAPADFDGDGKTDLAVFRPSTSSWYILNSSNNSFTSVVFGAAEDVPAPADFDGDGRADVAVFRPSTGAWFVQRSTQGFTAVQFGNSEDVPQTGDFDGDGKADISVYRPSTGAWYRINSSNNQIVSTQFGAAGDIPDAADFDGDGKTDIAVFRPANGAWYLQESTAGFTAISFGQAGDVPVAADFDGDGKADVAVFRPSSGAWYINGTTTGFSAVQFGASTDVPAESAFDGQ